MLFRSVMPSSHLILCRPLLLLPPIPPSIRVFSNESTLHTRWPKYWSFSLRISPSNEHLVRESFPRQVDKKSRGPQGERGLEFSRKKKGQSFFPLHSLGLYNNNVSCLRTVSGLNLLFKPVILNVNYESRSGEVFTTSRHLWIHWRVYNSIANTRKQVLFLPPLMSMSEALSPLYLNKTLLHKSSERSSLISGPG